MDILAIASKFDTFNLSSDLHKLLLFYSSFIYVIVFLWWLVLEANI